MSQIIGANSQRVDETILVKELNSIVCLIPFLVRGVYSLKIKVVRQMKIKNVFMNRIPINV